MRRRLGNLALAAFTLLLAFGLGEILVRWFRREDTVLFPRYQTAYRYGSYVLRGTRPNADFWHTSAAGSWRFTTNSKGQRDTREFGYPKPPRTLRVLSLGDSHTQGYEVRQDLTFSAVLERYLAHRKVTAEVINAGVSGFGTAEELAYLENEGFRFSPDVVVLGFFANDYEDNLKAGLFDLDGAGSLIESKREHVPGVRPQDLIYALPGTKWLGENSYFYSMLFNGVWNFFKAQLEARAAARARAKGDSAPATAFEYAVATTASQSAHQVSLAAALLERMRRDCEERKVRLIVVDIPVVPAAFRFGSSLAPSLRARLAGAGIEYVDSLSLLAELDGAAELYVPHGLKHISELGHALIGVELGRRLLPAAPAAP